MRVRIAILSTLLAALAGCAACDSVPDAAVTDCSAQVVPGGAATDVLFVIDDSGSMSDKQNALAANLSQFIDALVGSPIRLDVRIGVTNTSVDAYGGGTKYGASFGGLAFPGPVGTPYPAGAIVAIEQDPSGIGTAGHFLWGSQYDPVGAISTWGGPRILTNGATLARDFKANVHQGDWGSGKEQPLRAMKLAIESAGVVAPGSNFGFLRSGARLAVVILTDEDDCSESAASKTVTSDSICHTNPPPAALDPLADFVQVLDSTVGDSPIVALIAGYDLNGDPAICKGVDFGTAINGSSVPRRLDAFLTQLDTASPGRTFKRSICGTYGPALLQIAAMIIPQTMPLDQAPQDWRLLAVALNRGGTEVPCRVAPAGSAGAPAADAVFTPSQSGAKATLTFQNVCKLGVGDRVDLRIVCAG